MGQVEVGHAVDAWHNEHVGKRELLTHDPRPAVVFDRIVHTPASLFKLTERLVNVGTAEPLRRPHLLEQLFPHLAHIHLLVFPPLLIEAIETIKENPIERRYPDCGDRHFLDVVHPGAHAGAFDDVVGGQMRWLGKLLIKIFADDARLDDWRAVIDQGRHDGIRVDRQILRLELVLFGEVKLDIVELEALLVQDKPDLLATGGVGGVIENEHWRADP